jgi:dihydrofolate reductase
MVGSSVLSQYCRDGLPYNAAPPTLPTAYHTVSSSIADALPQPRVTIIAAIAANNVIGNNNALPWRLPADLQRFRRLTTGHSIIMGRKTFDSLGRLLPERTHVVLSHRAGFSPSGVVLVGSLAEALRRCAGQDEVFVIGGAEIYRLALAHADRLQLTEIRRDFAGDAHFPDLDRSDWTETFREAHRGEAEFDYDFVTYERKISTRRH